MLQQTLSDKTLNVRYLETNRDIYDSYQCTLSEKFQEIAKEELREDENIRSQSLSQLREWIAKHSSIKRCRTDAPFLLRFLRTKKFSVPMACQMLENYLIARQVLSDWFQKLNIDDPALKEIIDAGYIFPLPERDEQGRRILFSCISRLDASKFKSTEAVRAQAMVIESLLDEEESQVAGYISIYDGAGVTMSHISLWSLVDLKKVLEFDNGSVPMRHKEKHIVNSPALANIIIEFVLSLMSDKMKKRVVLDKTTEDLKSNINPAILPKEYGGTIPIKDMIGKLKVDLKKQREKLLALDDMYIDLTSDLKSRSGNDNPDADGGLMGSFRKLEMD